MTADTLATALSSLAAILLPVTGGWAWKTQQTLTEHSIQLEERKTADEERRARLIRIEDKIDERLDRIERKLDDARRL